MEIITSDFSLEKVLESLDPEIMAQIIHRGSIGIMIENSAAESWFAVDEYIVTEDHIFDLYNIAEIIYILAKHIHYTRSLKCVTRVQNSIDEIINSLKQGDIEPEDIACIIARKRVKFICTDGTLEIFENKMIIETNDGKQETRDIEIEYLDEIHMRKLANYICNTKRRN